MTCPGKILLHTCCGPCATTCTERLIASGSEVVLYFSNSNIFPEAEYLKRLENARKLSGILGLRIEVDPYDHEAWLEEVKGLENEPEQGARCMKCFAFSFARTSATSDLLQVPSFTTSLSVSRHKKSDMIFEAGKAFPKFVPIDFKKQDGYARSIELSKAYGLYRQLYCGCEFSMRQHP